MTSIASEKGSVPFQRQQKNTESWGDGCEMCEEGTDLHGLLFSLGRALAVALSGMFKMIISLARQLYQPSN